MEFSLPNLVVSIIFFVRLECTHAGDVSFISLSEFSFVMLSERSSPFLGTVLPCRQSCNVFFLAAVIYVLFDAQRAPFGIVSGTYFCYLSPLEISSPKMNITSFVPKLSAVANSTIQTEPYSFF